MIQRDLVAKIAKAIAVMEGYRLFPSTAHRLKLPWPPKARRLGNPGMIRQWKDAEGHPYPEDGGFVDFIEWAKKNTPAIENQYEAGHAEGWRVLYRLVTFYVEGRFHNGNSPTLYEFFEKYAPSSDANNPKKYAEFVAKRVGISPSVPLKSEVTSDDNQPV